MNGCVGRGSCCAAARCDNTTHMYMLMNHVARVPAYVRPVLLEEIENLAEQHGPGIMYDTPLDSLDPASW
jgi:hypothetical protein